MTKTLEYTHPKLNEDLHSIAGYYTPEKEVKLNYNDRKVLYVIGEAVVEASCCGNTSWRYALVPGYIVHWKKKRNEAGLPVSEVAPISEKEARNNIKQTIQSNEATAQVQFW